VTSVGLVLVGAGRWGSTLGRVASSVPGAHLRWVCELDPNRREAAAAFAPTARLTASLDEALGDPTVSAALVAVDSLHHHAVGLRVLEAGRHLLVEKPMALTVADAVELRASAEARSRVLSVGHLLLHHPAVRRARELILAGAIGRPRWLQSVRLAPGPPRTRDGVWWALAPHDVSLALYLFGDVPISVGAVAPGGIDGTAEETVAWANLQFADGRVAHIEVARQAPEKRRRFTVVGSERALDFDELAPQRGLRLYDWASGEGETVAVDAEDALGAQLRHFVSSVVRLDTGAGNGNHALAVVRVLDAGSRSIRAGGEPARVE
jgi:predicted dehydrogenase